MHVFISCEACMVCRKQKKQPDLNWENPEVRKAVYEMMIFWCEKGVDGFRMDVISMISKQEGLPDDPDAGNGFTENTSCNGPRIHEFLREMNREVLSGYPLITVGECPGVNAEDAVAYASLNGSELGMTNAYMDELSDYRDIESINAFEDLTKNKNVAPETPYLIITLKVA